MPISAMAHPLAQSGAQKSAEQAGENEYAAK